MKIILDAMGGDNGIGAVIGGAVLAMKEIDAEFIISGNETEIRDYCQKNSVPMDKITILPAQEVITMEDDPTKAIREKRSSSMCIGLTALKNGEGDAFISTGNTGALLTGATLLVGRIRGVRRAAIGTMFPSADGKGTLLMDCGANAECTSEYLMQFAEMGCAYMQAMKGIENPRIALISNGTEEHKGTTVIRETHALMKEAKDAGRLNFVGNVECRDVLYGKADVLVCDGFTGNAILKTTEGTAMFLMDQLKSAFMSSLKTKLAALIIKPSLRPLKKMLDYKEIGGTPIMGIAKPVFKAHGSSDEKAICSAIKSAVEYCKQGANERIAERIGMLKEQAK